MYIIHFQSMRRFQQFSNKIIRIYLRFDIWQSTVQPWYAYVIPHHVRLLWLEPYIFQQYHRIFDSSSQRNVLRFNGATKPRQVFGYKTARIDFSTRIHAIIIFAGFCIVHMGIGWLRKKITRTNNTHVCGLFANKNGMIKYYSFSPSFITSCLPLSFSPLYIVKYIYLVLLKK